MRAGFEAEDLAAASLLPSSAGSSVAPCASGVQQTKDALLKIKIESSLKIGQAKMTQLGGDMKTESDEFLTKLAELDQGDEAAATEVLRCKTNVEASLDAAARHVNKQATAIETMLTNVAKATITNDDLKDIKQQLAAVNKEVNNFAVREFRQIMKNSKVW